MNIPQLSIIVPAYNMEKRVGACVDSILSQSYRDFELLLINDGSTDCTEEIVLQRTVDDTRLKYFYKENGGVSSARNFGIAKALGKYILFIDADDEIVQDYLMHIMENTIHVEADVYIWGITRKNPNGTQMIYVPQLNGLYDKCTFLTLYIGEQYGLHEGLYGYVPNKLLRTSIVKNEGLRFDTCLKLMEDYDFFLDYYAKCDTFYCFDETGYIYFTSESSDKPRNKQSVSYSSLIEVQMKCVRLLEQNGAMSPTNRSVLNHAIAGLCISMFLEMRNASVHEVRKSIDFIKNCPYAYQTLEEKSSHWRLLRYLILWKCVLLTYFYVRCWRTYLSLRTYNL